MTHPYYTREPGKNVDPVDVGAGLAMLSSSGYEDKLTTMVVEHSLVLWGRGEEESAEKKAIDKNFHGIDLTTWKMVLAAAVAAGTQKLEQQKAAETAAPAEPAVVPFEVGSDAEVYDPVTMFSGTDEDTGVVDPDDEERGDLAMDLREQGYEAEADEVGAMPVEDARDAHEQITGRHAAQLAIEVGEPWNDVTEVEIPGTAVQTVEGVVALREATAQDVVMLLLEHHASDEKHDCGAQTEPMPCQCSNGRTTHVRHCTLDPSHRGDHKDALHCWSFETFTDQDVVRYAPRNLAGCTGCARDGRPAQWPCPTALEVLEVARQLGVEVPPAYREVVKR